MPTHGRLIRAVFQRNFVAYFINPTGYVFITVFILLGAMAAFWREGFFLMNLANLDQLNAVYPVLLLFFIPALTMNVWSEERRQGTDEILLTLPGRDLDIVLGKYLAALGIYTVAVLFSLSHVIILMWLGAPDMGLMLSTYLGYWLIGGALIAVGMVASMLTSNATVAFILGSLFCSIFVFLNWAESMLGWDAGRMLTRLSIGAHLQDYGDGLLTVSGLVYVLSVTGLMLYFNVLLLRMRQARGGEHAAQHMIHLGVRAGSVLVSVVAFFIMVERTGAAGDATAERLHTLHTRTRSIVEQIPDDRPVFIEAFVSPEVPESFVRVRKDIVNTLHRLDAVGGNRLRVIIHDTEPFSTESARASDNYSITPRAVAEVASGRRSAADVFLGLVFTSGPEEFVIPFFDRGLPVEYELARSIRVVSRTERKKVGVIDTAAKVFGGFDFQTMSSSPDWSFVRELRKQYEVVQVTPAGPYPDDLDALVAIVPSTLTQPEQDTLRAAIADGLPTMIFEDPLPIFNPQLSPSLPSDAARNPFTSQGQPPPPPKGDINALLGSLGLGISGTSVVWNEDNPHPAIAEVSPEIVFVAGAQDNRQPFNPESPISSGLQEVVMLYPGAVRENRAGVPGSSLTWTPLLQSGTVSGETPWSDLLTRGIFGMQLNQNPRRYQSPAAYSLALEVQGMLGNASSEGDTGGTAKPIHVILAGDVDLISESFFNLRRQGFEGFHFDNVTFALNCIDLLAGDESFLELRKHRPHHRSLTRVEQLSRTYAEGRRTETEAAEIKASDQIRQAQLRLDEKVKAVQERSDLDSRTRDIMLRNLQKVENKRLSVVKATIEQDKEKAILKARTDMELQVASIQRTIKWWAAALPPIPTLILALALYVHRYKREKFCVSEYEDREDAK